MAKTVTVKSGDTLSKIAKDNNTTVSAIAKASGISNPDKINVGQKITIPSSSSSSSSSSKSSSSSSSSSKSGSSSSSSSKSSSSSSSNSSSVSSSSKTSSSSSNLKVGSSGSEVKALQEKLIAAGYNVGPTGADGKYGANTEAAVKAYQKANGLTEDGIAGSKTKNSLNSNTETIKTSTTNGKENKNIGTESTGKNIETNSPVISSTLSYGSKGDEVKALQQFLVSNGYLTASNSVDGIFGAKTRDAVKAFQTANNLSADGIVGTKTKTVINNSNSKNEIKTEVEQTESVNLFDEKKEDSQGNLNTDNIKNTDINTETNESSDNSVNYNNFYGQERNAGAEQDALTITKYMAEDMEDSDIISSSFLKSLTSDYKQLAFYVNALTYGGYTIGDVINDIERNYMISKGNKNASNIKIIDASLTKAEATQKGSISSESDILSLIPESIMNGLNIDTEILSYGSENIPDELFNELVPLLDNTSDEYKDAVEDLMATYSDLANTQLEAETEQQKAVADYNMKIFKDQLKEKYHLALSDNADEAWAQIEGLLDNYNTRNLSGSGIEQESIDEQLKKTREEDRRSRVDKLNIEEAQMAEYYQKYATADEIAELIAEDNKNGITKREDLRAYKWGLIPSSNIIEEYSLESLAEKYPDLTNEELQNKRNAILDENNNYRSTIYKNYYSGILTNEETQRETAEDTVIKDAAIKEKNAYEDYDKNTAFLGQTATGSDQYTKDNSLSKSAEAANNSRTTKTTDSTNKTTDSTVQSNTATTGTTTPTKKSYTTLYDYYTANGGYNTWNSAQRKADASKAKITNYTGTAEQNKLLLDHLNNN
jgi:peptidoglycan hydrolase-like protein with peptidoglycan-binding domain